METGMKKSLVLWCVLFCLAGVWGQASGDAIQDTGDEACWFKIHKIVHEESKIESEEYDPTLGAVVFVTVKHHTYGEYRASADVTPNSDIKNLTQRRIAALYNARMKAYRALMKKLAEGHCKGKNVSDKE